MSVTTNCIYEAGAAPNAETVAYTAAARTIIDKCSSYGVAIADLTIKLIPSGGVAAAENIMEKKTHAVGEAHNWPGIVGHTLEVGDSISVLASLAASVNLRISGRKVT